MAVLSAMASIASCLRAGEAAATPACSYQTIAVQGPVDPLFGQYQLRLNDMNDAGLAVGHYFIVGKRPCTWSAESGFKAIPMPVGVSEASADRINNNGWILVNGTAPDDRRGFGRRQ